MLTNNKNSDIIINVVTNVATNTINERCKNEKRKAGYKNIGDGKKGNTGNRKIKRDEHVGVCAVAHQNKCPERGAEEKIKNFLPYLNLYYRNNSREERTSSKNIEKKFKRKSTFINP